MGSVVHGLSTRSACVAALTVASALATIGCRGRALVPNEADKVREELAARTRERDAARARVAELETELAKRAATPDPELAEATPALAAFSVSTLSSATFVDANSAEVALVFVPTDGRGRFLQVAGSLKVSVAAVVAGETPQPAGSITLGPKALRDAYRSGFMGTHYTVELPVSWKGATPPTGLSVSAEFTDGATGRAFPAVATMRLLPARPRTTDAQGAR
jgi:hypothetical protein